MKLTLWFNCRVLTGLLVSGVLFVLSAKAETNESLVMIEKLQNLQLDQLSNPQIRSDAIPAVISSIESPHKMLIIPVAYANRGFDRFSQDDDAAEKNQAYFEELLFSNDLAEPKEKTLTHYYYHQSKGQYYVTGKVLPLVTVHQPSDFYGKPIQNSDGQWRNDSRPEVLVEDVLRLAVQQNPGFNWNEFDVWDPQDYDGDGVNAEADGYIDHFVLVFAGKSQSSCQRLFSLNEKFTANAEADLFDKLTDSEQECAQRIWPHRFSITKNNGRGPEVEGFINRRGGIPLKEGLWVYDYNMQSEYTSVSTFIHEFGHSIGLPDIYASQTSNSTASWEAMSSTVGPVPQELSTWSRLMLGWMKPCIISPRPAGGLKVQSVYLKTMNDWNSELDHDLNRADISGLCDSAMVILPPKIKELRMGPLQEINGKQAAYTGQGNDLNHFLSRYFNLITEANEDIILEFDTWFKIEADWDYLYVEISTDGENYQRLLPTDKSSADDDNSIMASLRGHDGIGTLPGFTGRSGDLDGDGKVESFALCDPMQQRILGEERVGITEVDPCDESQWLHAEFDLSDYRGEKAEIRFHYFADMAAVEDGALIDNITIKALNFYDDFEADSFKDWSVEGFSLSSGIHDIAVPHFYLLEYRDPYEEFSNAYNYDQNLANPGFSFGKNFDTGEMEAIDFKYRSGVLMWYYNGSYLWSQNEPSQFGPGEGFLLLVDSTPQEFDLSSVPDSYYKSIDGWRYYDFSEEFNSTLNATPQSFLETAYLDVMCFVRRPEYYPIDLSDDAKSYCSDSEPAGESISFNGRQLMYSYSISNEFLPGKARAAYKSMGGLFDIRLSEKGLNYRLYDRLLRNAHSADAPFSLKPFDNGLQFYGLKDNVLVRTRGRGFSAVSSFNDSDSTRYLNPHLPFGSANVPNEGLSFELAEPGANAPSSAKVKIYFSWER